MHPIAQLPLFWYISVVGRYSYGKQYGNQIWSLERLLQTF